MDDAIPAPMARPMAPRSKGWRSKRSDRFAPHLTPVFCSAVAAVMVAFEIVSAVRDAASVVAPYAEETASAAWSTVREAASPTAAEACRTASVTCDAVPAATSAVLPTEELICLPVSRTASPTCSAPCIAVRKIDLRPPPPNKVVLLPPMNIQSTPIPTKAAEMGFSRTASWSAFTKSPLRCSCGAASRDGRFARLCKIELQSWLYVLLCRSDVALKLLKGPLWDERVSL